MLFNCSIVVETGAGVGRGGGVDEAVDLCQPVSEDLCQPVSEHEERGDIKRGAWTEGGEGPDGTLDLDGSAH
eukprot:scaffold94121_cov34-Tisochrysis_lutea.AAC.2